jgi:hypothetical protein
VPQRYRQLANQADNAAYGDSGLHCRFGAALRLIKSLQPMSSLHSDLDFISSICSNFSDAVNESGHELCGQDSYEVLTVVFGNEFSENDLRKATSSQYEELSDCLRAVLDVGNATPSLAEMALSRAVHLWR